MAQNKVAKVSTLSDLAPKGIDGKVWIATLKKQLLSARPDGEEPSNEDLLYLASVSQASGLDPSKRELYGIYRNVKSASGQYTPKLSIQTSIDGLRVVAERSGAYAGSDEPEFQYDPDERITVQFAGNQRIVPNRVKVTVRKVIQGQIVPTTRTARWVEFYPGDTMGGMWKKMPEVMLSKVAEAQALRAAFPNTTTGLYIEEEMQQADSTTTNGVDIAAIKDRIAEAKTRDDLMDILSDQDADTQKLITPLVDAKAKELQE